MLPLHERGREYGGKTTGRMHNLPKLHTWGSVAL